MNLAKQTGISERQIGKKNQKSNAVMNLFSPVGETCDESKKS